MLALPSCLPRLSVAVSRPSQWRPRVQRDPPPQPGLFRLGGVVSSDGGFHGRCRAPRYIHSFPWPAFAQHWLRGILTPLFSCAALFSAKHSRQGYAVSCKAPRISYKKEAVEEKDPIAAATLFPQSASTATSEGGIRLNLWVRVDRQLGLSSPSAHRDVLFLAGKRPLSGGERWRRHFLRPTVIISHQSIKSNQSNQLPNHAQQRGRAQYLFPGTSIRICLFCAKWREQGPCLASAKGGNLRSFGRR